MKKWMAMLLLAAPSVFAAGQSGFMYNHQPIDAACVEILDNGLVAPSTVSAINLTQCQQAEYPAPAGYHYQFVGQLKNGVDVLHTYRNTGGSMVSENVLFVRVSQQNQYVYGQNSAKFVTQSIGNMQLLGYMTGGDRCVGGFTHLAVSGNDLKVEQYQGKNAQDCQLTHSYTVNLSKMVVSVKS